MMGQESSTIPVKVNVLLAVVYAAVNIYQFFVLPLWLLPMHVRWAWTLLPLALLTNPFWSLIHEAIHDLFHPRRAVNLFCGRMLAILFGSPFRILRAGHLLHHKLNRTPREATELYERGKTSPLAAGCGYYFQILGGLYLVEVLSPLLFVLRRAWLPTVTRRLARPGSVSAILLQSWSQREAVREIRADGLCILVWFGASFFCYGVFWPWLLAGLAARAFLISFLDNVYHYRTPVNDIFFARNLRLPAPVAAVLLHFNLHGIHHMHPAVPWPRLPRVFRAQAQIFHGGYFTAAASQLLGPVALEEVRSFESRG